MTASIFGLKDKVAIVTGSARGIGKVIASALAQAGAKVVVTDLLEGEIEATAAEIRGKGGMATAIPVDVRDKQQVANLMQKTVAEYGRIDILVNNAGLTRRATLLEMSEETWDMVLDVNLKGTFLCCQAVASYMMEQRYGKIINISSLAGRGWTDSGGINYAVSKAGVIQLTKGCAKALGEYNINVNAIAPGSIETPLVYAGRTPQQAQDYMDNARRAAAIGRLGIPQDIANTVLYLASEYSSFISGQTIPVDGGRCDLM